MRKLAIIIAIIIAGFTLTGCEAIEDSVLQEQINAVGLRLDELEIPTEEAPIDYYTIEELDAILVLHEPSQVERWMDEMLFQLISDGDVVFVELDSTIVYEVEAYGYSPTYIYEVVEPMTLQFTIYVDNDLEFCYYPETMFGDTTTVCTELAPDSLFNDGDYVFMVDLEPGFFEFDFESWDESNPSIFNLTINEVVSEDE